MTGATLFTGIRAPEIAMPDIDWRWCAEIEPFCCALIAHHAPNTPNLGDVTANDFIERAQSFGPLDLLVGGSPCQAFSVAGLRRSLADERGNLTLRFVEIVHALKPRIVLWENVPGILATGDNAFGCFLAGLVGHDAPVDPGGEGWTSAGVVSGPIGTAAWRILDAQYFGLAQRRKRVFLVFCFGDSADPAEILFEFEGLRRDSPPGRAPQEDVAGTIGSRTRGSGGFGTDFELDGGIVSYALNGGSGSIDATSETLIAGTLKSNNGGGGFGSDPSETFVATTLQAGYGKRGHDDRAPCVVSGLAVRRLTPREWERLQGFPDDYTLIPYRGKPAADGPRYKAIGNSMAVPVLRWIYGRIRRDR